MKKNDMLRYTGDLSQLFGIRDYVLSDGKAKGVRAIDVNNGSGLCFTVLPDRGMDIAWLSNKGVNYSYISKSGIVAPQFFNEKGVGFLRNFYAGFLTTCGLTYIGSPCVDEGEELGIHGRISNIPAGEVVAITEWENEKPVMRLSGKMRESTPFRENLVLKREIICYYKENRIYIKDTIENEGFSTQPLMILYHYNLGYPLLDENAEIIMSKTKVTPRDNIAKSGIDKYNMLQSPTPGYCEQVFYHDLEPDNEGMVYAGLVNRELGHAVKITHSKEQLGRFTQWKQMGESEYVLGLEPCNAPVEGRRKAREDGLLEFIEPGEKRNIEFLIDFYSEDELKNID